MGIDGTALYFAMVFGGLAVDVVWRWKGRRCDPWCREAQTEPLHPPARWSRLQKRLRGARKIAPTA
jgi:hypothetical protein